MSKTYEEWLKYYENATKEQIIEDVEHDNLEIERLKEELKYSISIVEHNKTIQSNINSYNKLAKYSNELEDRINKAIEYMNDTIDFSWKDNSPIKNGKSLNLNKLLNILKGSDKE